MSDEGNSRLFSFLFEINSSLIIALRWVNCMTRSNLMRGSSRSEMINESSAALARIFRITRIKDTGKFLLGCCAARCILQERKRELEIEGVSEWMNEWERVRERSSVFSRPCLNVSAPSYAGNTPQGCVETRTFLPRLWVETLPFSRDCNS